MYQYQPPVLKKATGKLGGKKSSLIKYAIVVPVQGDQ